MDSSRHWLRIRKSSWLVVLLAIVYVATRMVSDFNGTPKESEQGGAPVVRESYSLVISRSKVDGMPFGEDSLFHRNKDRVHFFTRSQGFQGVAHRWYYLDSMVLESPCEQSALCESSLSPESLWVGEWSVDLMHGNHLLGSRQFWIVE